jgi:hypothetical protein
MTKQVILLFAIECVIGAIAAVYEKNWGMLVYFMGGVMLNIGLLMLK